MPAAVTKFPGRVNVGGAVPTDSHAQQRFTTSHARNGYPLSSHRASLYDTGGDLGRLACRGNLSARFVTIKGQLDSVGNERKRQAEVLPDMGQVMPSDCMDDEA